MHVCENRTKSILEPSVYIILAEGPGVARGKKWEENKEEEKYRFFLA